MFTVSSVMVLVFLRFTNIPQHRQAHSIVVTTKTGGDHKEFTSIEIRKPPKSHYAYNSVAKSHYLKRRSLKLRTRLTFSPRWLNTTHAVLHSFTPYFLFFSLLLLPSLCSPSPFSLWPYQSLAYVFTTTQLKFLPRVPLFTTAGFADHSICPTVQWLWN